MEDLVALSNVELRAELISVEADLEDLAEVRLATLGQTGVHLGAGKLAQLQHSWARDEARLIERRDAIQELLQSRQS